MSCLPLHYYACIQYKSTNNNKLYKNVGSEPCLTNVLTKHYTIVFYIIINIRPILYMLLFMLKNGQTTAKQMHTFFQYTF